MNKILKAALITSLPSLLGSSGCIGKETTAPSEPNSTDEVGAGKDYLAVNDTAYYPALSGVVACDDTDHNGFSDIIVGMRPENVKMFSIYRLAILKNGIESETERVGFLYDVVQKSAILAADNTHESGKILIGIKAYENELEGDVPFQIYDFFQRKELAHIQAQAKSATLLGIGDLDGNGTSEVVVIAKRRGEPYKLYPDFLHNNNASQELPYFIPTQGSLALADMNGDGLDDIILGTTAMPFEQQQDITQEQYTLRIGYLASDGFYKWETRAVIEWVSPRTEWLAVGDIDNDGKKEILLGMKKNEKERAATHFQIVSVPYDPSQQQRVIEDLFIAGDGTASMCLGDIDNDHDLDIAVGTKTYFGNFGLYQLRNNGNGFFE